MTTEVAAGDTAQFLLTRADGTHLVVDVKNPRIARKDAVQAVFAWTRVVCRRLAADYEVWTGEDPTVIKNVRFVAQVRRESRAAQVGTALTALPHSDFSIANAEATLEAAGIERPRQIILELLWAGILSADLTRPLNGDTVVQRTEAA
ncbi:hypothetical protein QEN42_16110 [Gordonia alkanivorans]|uniref:hypothetical protein n=1 Tax=Gordonia alkanivorans TaxID=84096 RepID=UPI00244CD208|nr:hypothetical protein [Gordonia alkanivorans]MDH3051375.1 hypothetical protein [Gordonia alkanivorans]